MSRSMRRALFIVAMVVGSFAATQSIAMAAPPDGPVGPADGNFLCPAVGAGVEVADAHNGDNGVDPIGPIASGDQSFLPGNNQAGAHANSQALNTEGPGSSPGPGDGNADWSPLWPNS
jgi:hypothetical protein